MPKPLIIFDAGGVLLKLNFNAVLQAWSNLSGLYSPRQIKERYALSEIEKQINLGESINFCDSVRKVLSNQTLTDSQIIDAFVLSVPGQIDEMVLFKQKLIASGYQVGILSTVSEIILNHVKNNFPDVYKASSEDLLVLSCKKHILKPSKGAYEPFVAKSDSILYIEDKAPYILPTLKLGWSSVHLVAFPDPDEPMQSFPGSQNAYSVINNDKCLRAESLDQAFAILSNLLQ